MTSKKILWAVVQAGLFRGKIEILQSLQGFGIFQYFFFPMIYAVVFYFMRNSIVPGTDFALSAMVFPGIVGMSIALGGLNGAAGIIAIDRENGTLLRAKATPNGMLGYLVSKIVWLSTTSLIALTPMTILVASVAGDLVFDTSTWLLLLLVYVLGMAATIPMGVALGSLMKSSAQVAVISLATVVIIGLSGIFYPISAMPSWLQWIGQIFPYYWLGLGARSALLPQEMASVELGESWRTLEMLSMLGIWVLIGLVCAPILLRRMARRQSGSVLAKTRERIISKGY